MSLGRAWHHLLIPKLQHARAQGFEGIELFDEDLFKHAETEFGSTSDEAVIQAAQHIRAVCDWLRLDINVLQPFRHYEGLVDRQKHAERITEIKFWFKLAHILGCNYIAIASSFLPASECSGDLDLIVSDLREIADLGLKEIPKLKFSYEALCWGTHINTWEQSWDIVRLVDRPNFGICLDTYNIAGKVYADPCALDGKTANAELAMKQSLTRMANEIDPRKLFYVQLVDAEKLMAPLVEGHEFFVADQPSRMSWSRNCRLFYGETDRGAYLPILDIAKTIVFELGYDGFLSMELFSRTCNGPEKNIPLEHAQRGIDSFHRLRRDLGLTSASASIFEQAW